LSIIHREIFSIRRRSVHSTFYAQKMPILTLLPENQGRVLVRVLVEVVYTGALGGCHGQ